MKNPLVEERSVVLGYDIEQVRIDERLAAEDDEEVDAHVLGFRDQPVEHLGRKTRRRGSLRSGYPGA